MIDKKRKQEEKEKYRAPNLADYRTRTKPHPEDSTFNLVSPLANVFTGSQLGLPLIRFGQLTIHRKPTPGIPYPS